jgi:hypothetical protein
LTEHPLVCSPRASDHDEADEVDEEARPELEDGLRQVCRGDARRHPDVEDEERQGKGDHTVAEALEPPHLDQDLGWGR